MSTTIEHKSVDGKASLTDTHLVYDFNLLARVQRQTKRSEIPLDQITGIRIVPGQITYLQVDADGRVPTEPANLCPLAFALDGRGSFEPFLSALREATGITPERAAAPAPSPATHLPSADFGGYKLRDGVLKGGGKQVSMQGAEAEATQGAPSQRSTLTRMGAGALIAGPIGFVVGAVARKNTSKCYVTIEVPDGVVIIESKAKDFPDAVAFASAVNRSAAAIS